MRAGTVAVAAGTGLVHPQAVAQEAGVGSAVGMESTEMVRPGVGTEVGHWLHTDEVGVQQMGNSGVGQVEEVGSAVPGAAVLADKAGSGVRVRCRAGAGMAGIAAVVVRAAGRGLAVERPMQLAAVWSWMAVPEPRASFLEKPSSGLLSQGPRLAVHLASVPQSALAGDWRAAEASGRDEATSSAA